MKYVFRKLLANRVSIFVLLTVLLMPIIVQAGKFLEANRILPIKNVVLESIDGGELKYISSLSVPKSIELAKSRNYLSLDINELGMSLKKESAFAKELIITKQLPSTVQISIFERIPVLVLDIETLGCVTLDAKGYVLQKSEGADQDCMEIATEYSVPTLNLADSKLTFNVNEQSTFYITEDIYKILLSLKHYGFRATQISLNDNILTIQTEVSKEFVFSMNQPVEEQLQRLVAVIGQISQDSIEFASLDLRYKRPVLRQK